MSNPFNENFEMTNPNAMFEAPVATIQTGNNGFNQSAPQNNNNGGGKKYRIFDFFWLINPKITKSQPLDNGEAGLVTIGYNADFDNMRVQLYGVEGNSFLPGALMINNTKRLGVSHLYAETRFQIMYNLKWDDDENKFLSFERMITQSSWNPNKTIIETSKKNESVKITSVNSQNNSSYYYKFAGWQFEALMDSIKCITSTDHWQELIKKI
jgi:hypothetical protein